MPKQSKDLTGLRFGQLAVIRRVVMTPPRYLCKCDCGTEVEIVGYSLQSGNSKSCGCLRFRKHKDLTGRRFGRLTVASDHVGTSGWICLCDCGIKISVSTGSLVSGNTQSCGCLRLERLKEKLVKHGGSATPEYRSWYGMTQRCSNPEHHKYRLYGARGIKVCSRWIDFNTFLADMGPKPSSQHSIERENGIGDYEPSNCKWALPEIQNNNRSIVRKVWYKGREMTARALINQFGSVVGHRVLSKRLFEREWGVEEALTTPLVAKEGRPVSDETKEKMRQAAFARIYKK